MQTRKTSELYGVYRELEDSASEMNHAVDGVIVEGPHDKKTLALLGYEGTIITCSGKRSHVELAEFVAKTFSRVVILTDFDVAGKDLNRRLSKLFEMKQVKVEHFYRKKFQRLLREARIFTIEAICRLKLELFD